jgi:hypothetical protein
MKRLMIIALGAMLFVSFEVHGQRANRNQSQSRPQNLARYVGKYPNNLFKDVPSIKQRLRALLGRNFNYQLFMENLSVQVPIVRTQNYLKLSGAAPQGFGTEEALLFISLSNGKIHCAILSSRFGGQYQVFSEDPNNLPESLRGEASDSTRSYTTIRLPIGKIPLVLRGSIVAGQEAGYEFQARKGQRVSIHLKESGVKFSLYEEHGATLAQDTDDWQGEFPESTGYQIIITTVESNAAYTLEITNK